MEAIDLLPRLPVSRRSNRTGIKHHQISIFDPANDSPCYECIFPEAPVPGLAPSCAEAGVLGPLTGVIGSMMAAEAVKLVARAGDPLRSRMLIYDALYADVRVIELERRKNCPICSAAP